jgi:cytosine/uracil/thiamine/allantoin permease
VAWVVGIAVSLLFTSSPIFTGPLATGLFASTSLGYLLGAAVSACIYLVLRLAFPPKESGSVERSGEESSVAS